MAIEATQMRIPLTVLSGARIITTIATKPRTFETLLRALFTALQL
jgi:hypothetical protein